LQREDVPGKPPSPHRSSQTESDRRSSARDFRLSIPARARRI
jgi:hypothetical protein